MSFERTLLATTTAIALGVSGALATPTDPTLILTAAASTTGAAQRLVRVDGSFHAQDLVQIAYPLQLLVHAGATYVRFDLANGAVSGVAPALADGLQAGEAEPLLEQGAPAPGARLLFLGRGRLEVTLPASFPAGPAEVQLFVVDEEEPVLSNALPIAVGATP